jgi:prokaryotic ubiquitin-like protein Pup
MAGEQKKKTGTSTITEDVVVTASPEAATKGQKLKEDLDDLLDEIDGVLETNAEDFVRNYIQKGGQ